MWSTERQTGTWIDRLRLSAYSGLRRAQAQAVLRRILYWVAILIRDFTERYTWGTQVTAIRTGLYSRDMPSLLPTFARAVFGSNPFV
jgi:hypothetical protein